jgi:hypothetical protein
LAWSTQPGAEAGAGSGYLVTESVFTAGAAPTKVDPNGDFEVDQRYVQYLIPAPRQSKYLLLMWHGGGLTGVAWETKPDLRGEAGWQVCVTGR